MINIIWAIMIIVGIVMGICSGGVNDISLAILNSAAEAVKLIFGMLGIMSFWSGIMKMADKAGIIGYLTKKFERLIKYLYPSVPSGSRCASNLTMNLVANFLGLGFAATPSGLEAMKDLCKLRSEQMIKEGRPSNDMCTFVILHVCSMQLVPINLIAYRNQYGSINPTAIVGYGIVSTIICMLVAILYSKICQAINRDK